MRLRQKKILLFAGLLILLLLAGILGSLFPVPIAIAILSPLLIVYLILYDKWWRCPRCGKSLGRLEVGVQHCKYCGQFLIEE